MSISTAKKSWISRIDYLHDRMILHTSGGTRLIYKSVPEHIAGMMLLAHNKNDFYQEFIRGQYEFKLKSAPKVIPSE